MSISREDAERVATEVRSAETRTSAEIVCVLASSSLHLTALPMLLAGVGALITPWILMAATAFSVQRLLSVQIIVFCLLLAIFAAPGVRTALLPSRARRAIAHQAGMEQFVKRGLANPKSGPAILIFVSLAERYARIIANEQAARLIPDREWRLALDSLIAELRSGRIADGFISAIQKSEILLERHFPQTPGISERHADRLHVI